jgi:hypothetical protein
VDRLRAHDRPLGIEEWPDEYRIEAGEGIVEVIVDPAVLLSLSGAATPVAAESEKVPVSIEW